MANRIGEKMDTSKFDWIVAEKKEKEINTDKI